jgi:membrane associated rhomboid family serine protease
MDQDNGLEPDPRHSSRRDTHVRRWGAVYVLLVLFIGSWLGQFFSQLSEFRSEQEEHDQAFAWPDFFTAFFSSTFENWQSEWLQLVFQAILLLGAKHLIFRVDAEDMERIEAKVDKINRHLEDQARMAKG